MEEKIKTTILVALSWVFIYIVYLSHTSNLFKITISVISLYIIGEYLYRKYKLEKEMVFLLWKNKNYLHILEKLGKKFRGIFLLISDMALFVAFGLLAFKIINWRNFKEKILTAIAGYSILFLISFMYSPSVSLLMVMLGIAKTGVGTSSILSYFSYIVFIIGLAPSALLALVFSSFSIAISLIKLITGEKIVLTQATTLLLPGINIPFFEGIIVLIALLIVHEFSHGILAVIGKIKVKSMGVVSFGSIPIGAFVEPDEKQLQRADKKTSLRVLIAGVSSNFLLAIISFTILLMFLYITEPFSKPSCLLTYGSKLIQAQYCSYNEAITINGDRIQLEDIESVHIIPLNAYGFIRYYPNPALAIIYNVLLLSASLNLVVGIINLLPIPYFDGDLIFSKIVPGKAHKIIRYLALACLLLSLIPGLI